MDVVRKPDARMMQICHAGFLPGKVQCAGILEQMCALNLSKHPACKSSVGYTGCYLFISLPQRFANKLQPTLSTSEPLFPERDGKIIYKKKKPRDMTCKYEEMGKKHTIAFFNE